MSSANPHTAKNIFSDTKRRLSERVSMNIHNTASVAREIIRGSKSNDIILTSAKGLAATEVNQENSMKSLKRIAEIHCQNTAQLNALHEAVQSIPNLQEQVGAMER